MIAGVLLAIPVPLSCPAWPQSPCTSSWSLQRFCWPLAALSASPAPSGISVNKVYNMFAVERWVCFKLRGELLSCKKWEETLTPRIEFRFLNVQGWRTFCLRSLWALPQRSSIGSYGGKGRNKFEFDGLGSHQLLHGGLLKTCYNYNHGVVWGFLIFSLRLS